MGNWLEELGWEEANGEADDGDDNDNDDDDDDDGGPWYSVGDVGGGVKGAEFEVTDDEEDEEGGVNKDVGGGLFGNEGIVGVVEKDVDEKEGSVGIEWMLGAGESVGPLALPLPDWNSRNNSSSFTMSSIMITVCKHC